MMNGSRNIKCRANIYLFKVSKKNTAGRCKQYSKLTIEAPERRHWGCSGVIIVNFKHILYLALVCFYYWLWTDKCLLCGFCIFIYLLYRDTPYTPHKDTPCIFDYLTYWTYSWRKKLSQILSIKGNIQTVLNLQCFESVKHIYNWSTPATNTTKMTLLF